MPREVTLLIIEDDEVDIKALKRAFRKLHIGNPMRFARDGQEGLDILRGENGQEKLNKPYLILLDLNMPRVNGMEFLEQIRQSPDLKASIVFVLTTSQDEQDRVRAYNHNVAGYVLKHDAERTFLDAVAMLEHYWKIIEFPCS